MSDYNWETSSVLSHSLNYESVNTFNRHLAEGFNAGDVHGHVQESNPGPLEYESDVLTARPPTLHF